MTDLRVDVLGREVLLTLRTDALNVDSLGREVLQSRQSAIEIDVLGREVLVPTTQVVERAAATDTVSATFSVTRTVSEAAGATDSVSAVFTGVSLVSETADAADAVSASFDATASITEAAPASDDVSAIWAPPASWLGSIAESSSADDAVSAVWVPAAAWSGAIDEGASADDAVSAVWVPGVSWSASITENASADDTVSAVWGYGWSVLVTETASASDDVTAIFTPAPWAGSSSAHQIAGSVGFENAGPTAFSRAGSGGVDAAFKIAGTVGFESAGTTALKIAGAVATDNWPTSALKIAGAVIIEYANGVPVEPPEPPVEPRVRCPVGMAEYTETVGLTNGYLLKGAIPGFATLRSQLIDKEEVRYRITNSQKEEVGEGWFDWPANVLHRTKFIVPTSGIDWGPGRKLIHIIEDYDDDVCLGARINPDSPLSIGIAEYTETTGTGAYVLKGPVREFFTLRGRIPSGATVKYRTTNVAKEEYGEGTFDAGSNTLIRNAPLIPSSLVNWGPGRKLIYINEK